MITMKLSWSNSSNWDSLSLWGVSHHKFTYNYEHSVTYVRHHTTTKTNISMHDLIYFSREFDMCVPNCKYVSSFWWASVWVDVFWQPFIAVYNIYRPCFSPNYVKNSNLQLPHDEYDLIIRKLITVIIFKRFFIFRFCMIEVYLDIEYSFAWSIKTIL